MAQDTRSFTTTPAGAERSGPSAHLVRALQLARPLAEPMIVPLFAGTDAVLARDATPLQRVLTDGRLHYRVGTDDHWMSSRHATVSWRDGAWIVTDHGSKNGTRANGVEVSDARLDDGDVLEVGSTMFVFRAGPPQEAVGELPALCTVHAPLAAALATLRRIAGSDLPIVVTGESGTGKEQIARAVHQLSGRAGAFVAVNCGALPATLIESQLFGHRRGAFSGAIDDAVGLVRAADGGTLLLDEIAELPGPSQAVLLRVLQEGEVLPLGTTTPVRVAVRYVAATHQDLAARVDDGRFRDDLLARLAGFELALPPLRARREDLGSVIGAVLRELAPERAARIRFDRACGRALFARAWPRNIRELRSALAVALATATGDELTADLLPPATAGGGPPPPDPPQRSTRTAVEAALRNARGNVSAAARSLGYSRSHFNRLIKQHGLDPAAFRG